MASGFLAFESFIFKLKSHTRPKGKILTFYIYIIYNTEAMAKIIKGEDVL